eukprot:SAG22_NODE_1469_length_4347_cov_2.842279_4_plen_424_part_01
MPCHAMQCNAGLDNWTALGEARAKFGLAELMEDPALVGGGVEAGALDEGVDRLRGIFHSLDLDGSGALDKDEVRQALERMGKGAAPEEVDRAMADMDDDQSGEVGLDEFEAWYKKQETDGLASQLAAVLQPSGQAPRAHATPKVREKKEKALPLDSAAVKLHGLAEYAGVLCREEPKPAGSAADTADEKMAEVREVFHSLDSDGSGALDKDEVRQALERLGKVVTVPEVDRAMADMDDDQSGEVGLDEFEAWYKKQEAAVGGGQAATKMNKYYVMVVALNADGLAVKSSAAAAGGTPWAGRRALVFFKDKNAMKPLGPPILSPPPGDGEGDAAGKFDLEEPALSIKLAMRYPYCFGVRLPAAASDSLAGGQEEEEEEVAILAAKDQSDQRSWQELLENGVNTFSNSGGGGGGGAGGGGGGGGGG